MCLANNKIGSILIERPVTISIDYIIIYSFIFFKFILNMLCVFFGIGLLSVNMEKSNFVLYARYCYRMVMVLFAFVLVLQKRA